MENKLLNKENAEAEFIMTFNPGEVRSMQNRLFGKYRNSLNINGFRKGKVPFQMAERLLGKGFLDEDIIETFIDENLENAIKNLNLTSLSQPRLEKFEYGPDRSLDLTIRIAIRPTLEPNDIMTALAKTGPVEYKEIEGEELDKAIEDKTDQILTEYAKLTQTNGPVENGDYIKLKINGTTSNIIIPRDYFLEVGKENPNFTLEEQEQFIGKGIGKPFEISVGPDKVKVTIEEISKIEKPELNEEFIQENFFVDDLEDFKTIIKNIVLQEDKTDKLKPEGDRIFNELLEEVPLELSPLYAEDIEKGLNPQLVEVLNAAYPEFYERADKPQAFLDYEKREILLEEIAGLFGELLGNHYVIDSYLHTLSTRNLEDFDQNLAQYVGRTDILSNLFIPKLAELKITVDDQ